MTLQPPPDQQADDILFADQFKDWGEKTTAARLMGTSLSNMSQQCSPTNEDRSYHHCGKLALYAAYMMDEKKGDALWADLAASRQQWKGQADKGEAPADSDEVAGLCQEYIGLKLRGATEEELKAVERRLYAASGDRLKHSIEEVRRRSIAGVSSAEGARR